MKTSNAGKPITVPRYLAGLGVFCGYHAAVQLLLITQLIPMVHHPLELTHATFEAHVITHRCRVGASVVKDTYLRGAVSRGPKTLRPSIFRLVSRRGDGVRHCLCGKTYLFQTGIFWRCHRD